MNSPLLPGSGALEFNANVVLGKEKLIKENFSFKRYIDGSRCLLFFYPLNFTFVCPSELIELTKLHQEFEKRKTKIVAVSVDSHFSHLTWLEYIEKNFHTKIEYLLVSDITKEISKSYGVLSKDGISFRASFIIDESFKVRHCAVNDFPLGRNIEENLRILDAIDHNEKYGEVCPASWQKGQKGMIPTQDETKKFLQDRFSENDKKH